MFLRSNYTHRLKETPFSFALSHLIIFSFFLFNTTILQAIIMQFVSEVATGGAKGGKYLDSKLSRLSAVYKKCCHLRYSDLWNRQNCWTSKCEIVVLLGMSFITRWAKEKQILINATVMQLTEEPKQPKLGWLLEKTGYREVSPQLSPSGERMVVNGRLADLPEKKVPNDSHLLANTPCCQT